MGVILGHNVAPGEGPVDLPRLQAGRPNRPVNEKGAVGEKRVEEERGQAQEGVAKPTAAMIVAGETRFIE